MTTTKIAVHTINNGLVGLAELPPVGTQLAAVHLIPGGGRVLLDAPDVIARVTALFGPTAHATNPYEQRRRKEFLRRASRTLSNLNAPVDSSPTQG